MNVFFSIHKSHYYEKRQRIEKKFNYVALEIPSLKLVAENDNQKKTLQLQQLPMKIIFRW